MAEMKVCEGGKTNKVPETVDAKDLTKEQCLEIIKSQNETIVKCKETMNKMYADLQSLSQDRVFTRLEYLFRVLDHEDNFAHKPGFVVECADEIYSLMHIEKKEDKKE